MLIRVVLISSLLCWVASAQTPLGPQPADGSNSAVQKLVDRLDRLEAENHKLVDEIGELRKELDAYKHANLEERVDVQEARTAELQQTKVEASHKLPVSLTGMLLFNSFLNGKSSGTSQYPVVAGLLPSTHSSGASLRQTVIGLKFDGPDLPGGGKASGNVYMDFWAGSPDPANHLFHLRVATLDLAWKHTTITAGQDKPIIAPREPTSLAQVGLSPLTSAGNLWDWQPQVRVEQRFNFGVNSGLRAQAGVYETEETDASVPAAFSRSLERFRPGYEGRFELFHAAGARKFEIAPGFHLSTTHVAGTSVPSKIASLDWMIKPAELFAFSGAWFRGQNVANLGALRQGFIIRSQGHAIPVHSQGGWGQLAFFPAPRWTVNLYAGQQHDRGSDLGASGISRNFTFATNFIYRLAPNILAAFEASQTRTTYRQAGTRLNNHYDLALAYLF